MIATSQTQNLWLGRSAWTVGILLALAALWLLVARVRGGHLPALAATFGALAGAVVFLIIAGGGELLVGLALGILTGFAIGNVTALIHRGRA